MSVPFIANTTSSHSVQAANQTDEPKFDKFISPGEGVWNADSYHLAATGRFLAPSAFKKSHTNEQRLREQTEFLTNRFRAVGINLQQPTDKHIITDVTKQVIPVLEYRNCNILPTVAAKNRRQFLQATGYYTAHKTRRDRNGKTYARYAVLTFGTRCTVYELDDVAAAANTKMRKLFSEIFHLFNVEVYFKGLEYTCEKCPETGLSLFHFHANILYEAPKMSDDRWAEFLSFVHHKLGSHWHDSGRIKDVHEVVKYPFKPSEIGRLKDHELVALYHWAHGRRFFEALRGFKEMRRHHKEEGVKYGKANNQFVLRAVNALQPPRADKPLVDDPDRTPMNNLVLARIPPSFSYGIWAEGGTLVQNYDPQDLRFDSQDRLQWVEEMARPSREKWVQMGLPDPEIAVAISEAIITSDDADRVVHSIWESALYSSQRDDKCPEKSGWGKEADQYLADYFEVVEDPPRHAARRS